MSTAPQTLLDRVGRLQCEHSPVWCSMTTSATAIEFIQRNLCFFRSPLTSDWQACVTATLVIVSMIVAQSCFTSVPDRMFQRCFSV